MGNRPGNRLPVARCMRPTVCPTPCPTLTLTRNPNPNPNPNPHPLDAVPPPPPPGATSLLAGSATKPVDADAASPALRAHAAPKGPPLLTQEDEVRELDEGSDS